MNMDEDLDKSLNREFPHKYLPINAKAQVRLLQISFHPTSNLPLYELRIVAIEDLPSTKYRALSYTWGTCDWESVYMVNINDQPFYIRQNLHVFFVSAAGRRETGLFFIDAICINQLDDEERRWQVQEMARIYRDANEVIAWLGVPDQQNMYNVSELSEASGINYRECSTWMPSQWKGFKYLSYHSFWTRMWIVQEVILASSMAIWCGPYTFPISLFSKSSGMLPPAELKCSSDGKIRNVIDAASRLRSPAETVTTHRLRYVPRPLNDPLAQGTEVLTLDEISDALGKPIGKIVTYQSRISDPLHQLIHKFGKQECTDPRDKLYGLLGIMNESSASMIDPDYSKDMNYAFYQALKVGLQEIHSERSIIVTPEVQAREDGAYLAYYCDLRDAFGMEDERTLPILRQVLRELDFRTLMIDAISSLQERQQFVWDDADVKMHSGFRKLVEYTAEEEEEVGAGCLFRYHKRQRSVAEKWVKKMKNTPRRKRAPPTSNESRISLG